MDDNKVTAEASGLAGESGAWMEFQGVVRPTEKGVAIRGIRYSAYVPMAEKTLRRIADEFAAEPGIQRVEITHLLGFVPAEAASLFLRVRGRHSAETLRVLEGCLAAVKTSAPIWKEFLSASGPSATDAQHDGVWNSGEVFSDSVAREMRSKESVASEREE